MPQYRPMTCRACGERIPPAVGWVDEPTRTQSYSDCYFHCPRCRIGYSNAAQASARTKIYPHFELNVPFEVRDNLAPVLWQAINEQNRTNKRQKFAFETSEDAVTWTVFRYLLERQETMRALGLPELEPERVMFWGCPYPCGSSTQLRDGLIDVLHGELAEVRSSLTEPDVVLASRQKLVFIEVKYRSPNDQVCGSDKFERYLSGNQDLFSATPSETRQAGWYELTRNWVAGSKLAARLGLDFVLVNIGGDGCRVSAGQFAALLPLGPRRFFFLAWSDLLERLNQPVVDWFAAYLATKQLG